MFKRVLSLCAAFVLVAGASGDLFALKESDVRIKVLNPVDGMFAKIGDTVHVEVYTFHADSSAINANDGGVDITVAVGDTGMVNVESFGDIETAAGPDRLSRSDATTSNRAVTDFAEIDTLIYRQGTVVDTFIAKIPIVETPSGIETGDAALSVHVLLTMESGTTDDLYITNLSKTASKGLGGGDDATVGDEVQFGVDEVRPTAAFIKNVSLAGGDGEHKFKGIHSAFSVGDTLKVSVDVSGSPGDDEVIVLLLSPFANPGDSERADLWDTADNTKNDSTVVELSALVTADIKKLEDEALTSVDFSNLDLKTKEKKEIVVDEGDEDFGGPKLDKNNRRVQLFAFVSDNAGNLALSARADANTSTLRSVSSDDVNTYVVDSITPELEIVNPQTGKSFTGAVSEEAVYVDVDDDKKRDVDEKKTFPQNPLKIDVTEGTASGMVFLMKTPDGIDDTTMIAGQDTVAKGHVVDYKNQGSDIMEKDQPNTAQVGTKVNMKVTVQDSAGNEVSAEVEGVTLDNKPIKVTRTFPFLDLVVDDKEMVEQVVDTLTSLTRDVRMEINEDADSISVRWVEVPGGPEDEVDPVKIKTPKSLKKGKLSVDFTFDSKEDRGKEYTLQIFARDKAGNITLTPPDTLVFSDEFANPVADTFLVTRPKVSDDKVLPDSSIVGQRLTLNIEAWDSEKDKTAVTYPDEDQDEGDVLVSVMIGDALASSDDKFKISEEIEGKIKDIMMNSDGTVSLDDDGWVLGKRTIMVTTEIPASMVIVTVEDTSTQADTDQETAEPIPMMMKKVDIGGEQDSLVWEVGEFVAYLVDVEQDDDGSRGFTITVTPVDSFGNLSTKTTVGDVTTDDDNEGAGFLTSRLPAANTLKTVSVKLSSPTPGLIYPGGRQEIEVNAAGMIIGDSNKFRGTAPSGDVKIVVRVTSDFPSGVVSAKSQSATGSSEPEDFAKPEPKPDPEPEDLAAPANLVAQDYWGPMGDGDQGGYIMVSFPSSVGAEGYQLWREIHVNTRLDSAGMAFVDTTSWPEWISWASIGAKEAGDDDIVRAVVPVTDGEPTLWGIQAYASSQGSDRIEGSDRVPAGKRVFTKESVQLMAQFLGIDPNRVLSYEELSNVFSPPQDYVKSILGDQEGVIFAPMNPDLTVLLATPTVPQSIRTASHEVRMSERKLTEEPAGAVDNIPPAAVTELKGEMEDGNIALNWLASADDKVVGFINYRGHAVSIPGVASYNVWRSVDDGDWEMVDSVEQGATSFVDENVPEGASMVIYRVDAADLDNQMPSEMLSVPVTGYVSFTDADGSLIYVVDLSPGRTDFTPSFRDFAVLASAFGANEGDANYVEQADTNQDGVVDFADFASFASTFGKKPSLRNGRPIGATKLVMVPRLGVNEDAEMLLSNNTDRVLVGQQISLDVSVANTKALKGFGFVLTFDSEKFEFLKAAPAENDLLKSAGGETPVFFEQSEQSGQIMVANSLADGEVVSGEGSVVTLTFKVLKEFEDNARFEIIEGIVFDHKLLSNQMVVLGALNVETTPTEFALFQNFPNPFNPETTIKYNLAEGSDVHLQIYNILGQVVRTMVAERQSAGRYQVKWSGTDDRGMPVSSGIYFYQLATGGKFHDVKRLMLLK